MVLLCITVSAQVQIYKHGFIVHYSGGTCWQGNKEV